MVVVSHKSDNMLCLYEIIIIIPDTVISVNGGSPGKVFLSFQIKVNSNIIKFFKHISFTCCKGEAC